MKRLSEILLIDDSEADCFLHRMMIDEADCAERVQVAANGAEAIDYLSTPQGGRFPAPELIFLDVNMPVMNGWEFLAAYRELPAEQQGGALILMLSTSLNPADHERAEKNGLSSEFISKPLSVEAIRGLLERYFPEHS